METIFITGMCGGKGRILAEALSSQYQIIGVDLRESKHEWPKNVTFFKRDLKRQSCADLFHEHQISAVIHLAVTTDYHVASNKRHEMNIMGTKRLIDDCLKYDVQKFVLVSCHSVYGALPNNPFLMTEEMPLNGSRLYPQMADIIGVDHMCTDLLWKNPKIETVILRPVNILGPATNGLLNLYLKSSAVPAVFGFDPMMQIIHERDVCAAIALSLQHKLKGLFNVTGPGSLPLSVIAQEVGTKRLPLPEPLAKLAISQGFLLKQFPFPASTLGFFQHVISVDGSKFQQATGFSPKLSLKETLASVHH